MALSCCVELLEVIEIGVLRRLHQREEDALVLLRRELPLRRHIHQSGRRDHAGQDQQRHRSIVQGAAEAPLIAPLQPFEQPVEIAREPAGLLVRVLRLQQLRAHHRRQRHGDDARHDHRAGERQREFAEQHAGQPRDEGDRRVDRSERDGHGDDRVEDLARAEQGRIERPHALLDMPVDVLNHDDGVVHHQPDGEHERQQRHQIDRVAERGEQRQHADQRQRDGDDRDDGRPEIAQEQEDHDDDDDRRLAERLHHFPERGTNEIGRVIGDGGFQSRRQLPLNLREGLAHIGDHRQRVRRGRGIDADEHGLQPIEGRGKLGTLRAKLDLRHVGQPDERIPATHHHQLAERLRRLERGLGVDIGLHEIALHLAGRRGEIVGGESHAHIERRHPERGHAIGIEPNAHGEHLSAEHLRVGHSVDGLQPGLHHARDVIADLRGIHHLRIEGEIHQRVALPGLLGDDGIVRLARQDAFDLGHLRQHVGHRPVGIGVELQVERDRADILRRGCGQRIDAFGARHRLLDRHGDEALDQVGVRARIGGDHGDRRVRQLGILADGQLETRLRADQKDQQADHGGEHWSLDEDIGEGHGSIAWAAPPALSAPPNYRP